MSKRKFKLARKTFSIQGDFDLCRDLSLAHRDANVIILKLFSAWRFTYNILIYVHTVHLIDAESIAMLTSKTKYQFYLHIYPGKESWTNRILGLNSHLRVWLVRPNWVLYVQPSTVKLHHNWLDNTLVRFYWLCLISQ